jgi:ABC-2 type transport system ATP-binding protein
MESVASVVQVKDLVRHYGDVRAVDGIAFEVARGEVFGLLGPNGAGKTTTIEMLEGLNKPDSGTAEVLGIDVTKHPDRLKERIGVQLQTAALYPNLTVAELVDLFASFYERRRETADVIRDLGLEERQAALSKELSGGQQQRLSIALALVNDPELIFLDEPTTGLDPQARRTLWDQIEDLRKQGRTILLTTHYMEEAERLCDRVAIVDHGKVIALGSPRQLIASLGGEHVIEFSLDAPLDADAWATLPGVSSVAGEDGHVRLSVSEPHVVLPALINRLEQQQRRLASLTTRHASLEDVFVRLTGRHIADDETEGVKREGAVD